MITTWAVAILAPSAVCAQDGLGPKVVGISYRVTPTFVSGPSWRVTVAADGRGEFDGLKDTRELGGHDFGMRLQSFADFRSVLEPFMPVEADRVLQGGNCGGAYMTDSTWVNIVWTLSGGTTRHLFYDRGCGDKRYAPLIDALGKAEALLPIKSFIGSH